MEMNENGVILEGFEMTELGPLPEEWEVVKVIDCCDFERGTEPGSDSYNRQGNGIPFIRVGNISAGIQELLYTNSNNIKMCKKEDILMSFDGSPGVVVKGFTGAYSSGIRKVIPKMSYMDKTFLFYTLKTKFVQNTVEEYTTGITIKHASKSLPHIKIPLPPLTEQEKIAAVLSAVQEAKEKTEAVINATRDLKKSMMNYLFTYGPVPVADAENVPLKETEIGMIPEEWEVVRFGDLVDKGLIKAQFGFPCGKWNDKGFGIAQIRPFNITNDGNINLQTLKYIETDKNISKYVLHEEDIIFNNTNSEELVGKTAYWKYKNNKFVLSNHMTIIRVINKDELCAVFLAKYLHKRWNDGFYKTICRRHVNQSSISLARLGGIKIIFPPLPTQQKIASILSTIDQKIEVEENKKKALEDLFKTLLHNLMTARIRVNNLEVEI